ncbi:MAG: hypothetical protein IMW89_12335 [Ktedonobacteraceae bacterium]|nr:hypothetical protein [Ktedonobacteraceae bacterium]
MQKRSSKRRIALRSALLFIILLMFAACGSSSPGGSSATQAGPAEQSTVLASNNVANNAAAGVKLGPQPCPVAVSDPAHWDPIIPTQPNVNKVESVTCANLMGKPALQALIAARSQGASGVLDIYVYDNITSPTPTQVFKLLGLYKGSVKISGYNTVLTGEVDQNSSVNKGQVAGGYTQDLFREFKWLEGAGTLVPVNFPGFYPDLTRYQAESDQAAVNAGRDGWKLNAAQVAVHFAADLLKWAGAQATVVSGGGGDGQAVVDVKSPNPGGSTVHLTLERLEGNTNGGIWIVTKVETAGLSLTAPQGRDRLSSPVRVAGTGNAFEGVIGKVFVFDHLYTAIGQAGARGQGNGATSFSASISYASTFKVGAQEGIVALYSYSNADGSIAGAVMLKELLMP